jgi:hypothetical protein
LEEDSFHEVPVPEVPEVPGSQEKMCWPERTYETEMEARGIRMTNGGPDTSSEQSEGPPVHVSFNTPKDIVFISGGVEGGVGGRVCQIMNADESKYNRVKHKLSFSIKEMRQNAKQMETSAGNVRPNDETTHRSDDDDTTERRRGTEGCAQNKPERLCMTEFYAPNDAEIQICKTHLVSFPCRACEWYRTAAIRRWEGEMERESLQRERER